MIGSTEVRTRAARLVAAVTLLATTGCAGAAMGGAAMAAPGAMSDPEIVGVVMASNTGEITTNQPATTRATTAAVRQFAQQMVTEHTAANQRLQALGIAPAETQLSRQLAANAAETARILAQYQGASFDRAHMESQVALHRWTLNSLDRVLIPQARSARLRTELQAMRGVVAGHLQTAEQILGTLR